MSAVHLLIRGRAVLYSPVRMMNELVFGLSLLQGHLKRLQDPVCVQAGMQVVAHDSARIRVSDQAEITRCFPGIDVGNVGNPELFGLRWFGPRPHQIGMLVEKML